MKIMFINCAFKKKIFFLSLKCVNIHICLVFSLGLRSLQDLMPFCVDFYIHGFGRELFSDAVKAYFLTAVQQLDVQEDLAPCIPETPSNDVLAKLRVPHLTVSRLVLVLQLRCTYFTQSSVSSSFFFSSFSFSSFFFVIIIVRLFFFSPAPSLSYTVLCINPFFKNIQKFYFITVSCRNFTHTKKKIIII